MISVRTRPSTLALESAANGDGALVDDTEHGAALAELRADDARILAELPPRKVADEIARRRRPRAPAARTVGAVGAVGVGAVGVACACACVAFLVVTREAPGERAKGGAVAVALHVWRATAASEPELLTNGAHVASGDVVQLTYESAGARYGAVVAVDGAGAASLVFPPDDGDGDGAGALHERSLAFALEIDDAPGFERFILVADDAPLDLREVLAAARELARDPRRARTAPLAIEARAQSSVLLLKAKEPPP